MIFYLFLIPAISGKVEPHFALLNHPAPLKKVEEGRVIVILVDFPDNSHRYSSAKFDELMFSPYGSVKDYYEEASYGKFTLYGEVARWIRLEKDYSYYVGEGYGYLSPYPENSQGLVIDALKKVDSIVDFSKYDWDGDGVVDGIFFVHAGPGAEATGDSSDIWSHKWQLSDYSTGSPGPYRTDDGVYVDHYTIQPELLDEDRLITIGVFCHEFGHMLGLPDLYDISPDILQNYYNGLGDFSLMASGSWGNAPGENPGSSPAHPDAWCKYFLGWLTPDSLESADEGEKEYVLPPSSSSPSALRILENPQGVDWSMEQTGVGEYFLIEYRARLGYDVSLPDSGLLILHVDESQEGNMNEYHPLVGIVQADGDPIPSLPPDSRGEEGDLWKNDTSGFTPFSIPPSLRYDGSPTGVYVKEISEAGSTIKFRAKIGVVFLSEIIVYPNPFVIKNGDEKLTITYKPNATEKVQNVYPEFKVYIFNIAGELIRVLDDNNEVKRYSRYALWDGKRENGIPATSGLYIYTIEMENTEGYLEKRRGKFTLIR